MSGLRILLTGVALMVTPAFCPAAAATEPADSSNDTLAGPAFVVDQGDTLWLAPPLVVVGSRVPASLPGVVRQVEILGGDELAELPGRSVAELLQTVPGVVTGQRQQYGVQSDLTVRGSTFEQVQVLLDGFDLTDPQTGHHLLNLPLARQDIERLEVLRGQGTALYGSGAFGGVVNVVSRRADDESGGEVAATGGGLGLWQGRASLQDRTRSGKTGVRVSFDRFHTDGLEVDLPGGGTSPLGNEADTWAATARVDHQGDDGESALFVGWSKRKFGAMDFYAPYSSRERTETFFASARFNRKVSDRWTLEPRLYLRRHKDFFVLKREDPDFYINDHLTRRLGAELRSIATLDGHHALALGLEGVYEDLDSVGFGWASPGMGSHLRRRVSASAELDRHHGRLRWQLGGRLDGRLHWDPRYSGTSALSYDLNDRWMVRASGGSVYRIPTWTELNYSSPANLGASTLKAERGWTWDAGLERRTTTWNWQLTWFERYERDSIEWVLPPAETTFQAWNIPNMTVRGLETGATWRHGRGHLLSAGWTWLEKDSALQEGHVGKYTLLTPRHVLTGRAMAVLPWSFSATLTARYLERTWGPADFRTTFLLDARVDWEGPFGWFVSAAGTNLTDRRYEEIPDVAMPGLLGTLSIGQRF